MNDCVICKIIAGELPTVKIYEDDDILAIMDLYPVREGHALVMPKEHTENILTISPELYVKVSDMVRKVSTAVHKGLGTDGIYVAMNNGGPQNEDHQMIRHAHVHVIPRFDGDGLKHWPQKPYEKEGRREELGEIIKKALG